MTYHFFKWFQSFKKIPRHCQENRCLGPIFSTGQFAGRRGILLGMDATPTQIPCHNLTYFNLIVCINTWAYLIIICLYANGSRILDPRDTLHVFGEICSPCSVICATCGHVQVSRSKYALCFRPPEAPICCIYIYMTTFLLSTLYISMCKTTYLCFKIVTIK